MPEKGAESRKNPTNIVLIPFSKSASQEFASPKKDGTSKAQNDPVAWDQSNPWHDQFGWTQSSSWHDGGGWTDQWRDKMGPIGNTEINGETKLRTIIKIRQDNEKFGFVHELESGVIFYADNNTLSLLSSLLDTSLSEINKDNPEILMALYRKV
ncbi:MAG: hypothetical protein KGH98_03280 [Candidatus Micrarchaeota archaeon]|nr:hypothetical protein [Candidatus Micrarchaeota archaeon]